MHKIPNCILVAFYSHSGHTKRLAHHIADRLEADVIRICPQKPFQWPLGIVRAGHMSVHEQTLALRETDHDPASYDFVILGSPVRARRLSPPTRSWIDEHKASIDRYACFYTFGGLVEGRVANDMANCLGRSPEAVLALSRLSNTDKELDRFVRMIAKG